MDLLKSYTKMANDANNKQKIVLSALCILGYANFFSLYFIPKCTVLSIEYSANSQNGMYFVLKDP